MGQSETKQRDCQKLLACFSFPFLIPSLGLTSFSAIMFESSLPQAAAKQKLLSELTKPVLKQQQWVSLSSDMSSACPGPTPPQFNLEAK